MKAITWDLIRTVSLKLPLEVYPDICSTTSDHTGLRNEKNTVFRCTVKIPKREDVVKKNLRQDEKSFSQPSAKQ